MPDNSLYISVVDITKDYLGPASGRFIDRQIANHLDKKPGKLESRDMATLIEWLRVAFTILTDDKVLIDEYFSRIDGLTKRQSKLRRR